MDSSFFACISFLIFAYIFYKKLWPTLLASLDEYIQGIKAKIDQGAKFLKAVEDQKLSNQKKIQKLPDEIDDIKRNYLHKLEVLTTSLEQELAEQYISRTKSFQQMVNRLLRHQKNELQNKIVNETFAQVEQILLNDNSFANEYILASAEQLKIWDNPNEVEC